MAVTNEQLDLVATAEAILAQTTNLVQQLLQRSISSPDSLSIGAKAQLWDTHDANVDTLRSDIIALTQRLDRLLEGPHEFLHDYVNTNWEHGALYALLEFNVLEKIPLDGSSVPVTQLAKQTKLPEDKLLRICRLVATAGILSETKEASFSHTAISELLVRDQDYKSYIHFELFETRVASTHLADSLKKPNPFWTGHSAFEHAWGLPMHAWHTKNPDKGRRFGQAMQSVSKGVDPANTLIIDWLRKCPELNTNGFVVEVAGKNGSFSEELAEIFPQLKFDVQAMSQDIVERSTRGLSPELASRARFRVRELFTDRTVEELTQYGLQGDKTPVVILFRSVLWWLDDAKVIQNLQNFLPIMRAHEQTTLLICDILSPDWGTFEPHVERAFRRRDVTLMTMHNALHRTGAEWTDVIKRACPQFKVTYTEKYSSHNCRGFWQVELDENVGDY